MLTFAKGLQWVAANATLVNDGDAKWGRCKSVYFPILSIPPK